MVTAGAERLTPDALANFRVVEAMGLGPVVARDATCQSEFVRSITPDDVVVDALLGTGFRGTVRSPTAELIVHVDRADKRAVVALDIPSGLDCDTGVPSNATLRADLTVTFVALKPGLIAPGAARYAGRVAVVDIGAPRELVAEVMRGLV
jgi:NAD(P)H-hydrate epimerase